MEGVGSAGLTERFPLASTTYKLVAAVFDVEFYLTRYPDVRDSGGDPIVHYLEYGWREGRDPSPSFSTTAYLEANPEVSESGECPLVDYVTSGIISGRPLRSVEPYVVRQQVAAAFDAAYYNEIYPDIPASEVDPLGHYLMQGWRENRNPSPGFDTKYYLEANADVREAGICPLVHYVTRGAAEGRLPRRPPNPARAAIDSAVASGERARHWLRPLRAAPIDGPALQVTLRRLLEAPVGGVALGLSHDDYTSVVGGVQNCVSDEERGFREKGWVYLHLSPAQPLPILAEPASASDFLVSMFGNGAEIGILSVATLISEFGRLNLGGLRRVLVLHHLLGSCPELVTELARAFAPERTVAWVHDFFTLCPNPLMLRNNVAFCGGPPPDSQACGICVYGGDERKQHLARMSALFDALKPDVLAPSETALNFWLAHGSLRHATAKIIPHGKLLMEPMPRTSDGPDSFHLRIGFAGGPAYHKGLHVFQQLASRHYQDARYSFFHLGAGRGQIAPNVTFVPVEVNAAQRHGMTETLIANQIDVVVNWSLCHETFSFIAYEAVAAGAFVLAPIQAGNVVPAITQAGVEQGLGLDNEADLFELFASGDLFALAARRRFGEFHVQAGTLHHLEGTA